jgi:acylphosphatase
VQGVGFRHHTVLRARSLGLGGWVANRVDGTVDAAFEGPSDRVESMVAWCRHGPNGASVDDVEVWTEPPAGEADFRVEFARWSGG